MIFDQLLYMKRALIILTLAKIPLKFLLENSLQGVRELGWPAAHVAAPQEPRGIDQVILLRLRQGVPHGFEQACWIPNFCPCLTKISLIKVYVCKPTDFDISSLTEGTISESATRRFTSRKRSSHASFAASPSCRKSTWRPTRESTLERNRESALLMTIPTCLLDSTFYRYACKYCPERFIQGTRRNQHQAACKARNGSKTMANKFDLNFKQGWKNFIVAYAFLMVAHDTSCICIDIV